MTELERADALFVFAGRESRKRLGVRLFREGIAPRLILSVGRFEWRRFPDLGLPGDGGLVELVQATEPPRRHFFVEVRAKPDRITCERIPLGRLGTWSEARALAALVVQEREGIRKLLVVSHPQHLPRCLLSLRALLPSSCTVVPVPCHEGEARAFDLRSSRATELVKYAGYWMVAHFKPKHGIA